MRPDLTDRSLPAIRDLADDYYPDHGWDDVEALPASDPDETAFKVEAWARKAVADDALPARLDYLRERARADDWRTRERVAMALKYVNAHAFEDAEPVWEAWVAHDDSRVRRACEVGLMGVADEHAGPALELLAHLVSDDDDYVKRSCGGFAVSTVASYDPAAGREHLDRWSRADDLRTRWNAAKAIGGAYGRENEHALDLAYRLAGDDAYRVRRAAASSLRTLFEATPGLRERVERWDDRDAFLETL